MAGEWNDAIRKLHGPAPKEKEMESQIKRFDSHELEAVWERAYLAALSGVSGSETTTSGPCDSEDAVKYSANCANATVAAWPAMTAQRDALIRKAVDA